MGFSDIYSMMDTAIVGGILVGVGVVMLIYAILVLVANWRIFTKAGEKGWMSLIPFLNNYIVFKIFWGNGWLFLVPVVLGCLCGIPFLGAVCGIFCAVIKGLSCYKESMAFGHGIEFAVGLFFLSPIFSLILAFGDSKYMGVPQTKGTI